MVEEDAVLEEDETSEPVGGKAQEGGLIDGARSKVVDPRDYEEDGRRLVTVEEVFEESMHEQAERGYSAIARGETFSYPRLNLSDERRATFLDGLLPVIDKIIADNPSGHASDDYLQRRPREVEQAKHRAINEAGRLTTRAPSHRR